MTTVKIQIGNQDFTAEFFDNASAQALLALLPITITMNDLNGNEKYYTLPQRLPTKAQLVRTINSGDLMLYGSDCLVLFYKNFNTPYSYTRLGHIVDPSGLIKALGSGNIEAKFSQVI